MLDWLNWCYLNSDRDVGCGILFLRVRALKFPHFLNEFTTSAGSDARSYFIHNTSERARSKTPRDENSKKSTTYEYIQYTYSCSYNHAYQWRSYKYACVCCKWQTIKIRAAPSIGFYVVFMILSPYLAGLLHFSISLYLILSPTLHTFSVWNLCKHDSKMHSLF